MSVTPMPSAAVEVHDLVKTYPGGRRKPDVRALDGLSFSIAAGTVYGMLGPNGAGKSTTTKICTTLSRADSGTARVAGFDVTTDAAAIRHRIGYVSQGSGADPRQTPFENLVMAARLHGLSRHDAMLRADGLLDQFQLTDARNRKVAKLSGGMRRKLDVAVGLVHTPSVLFLDEPTTGLDPQARAEMWSEIRRLAAEAALTVVLTTHYLEEADELADRLVIIDHGRTVIEGTPAQLKSTLDGDTLTVELIEPDVAAVRAVGASIPALRDIVVEQDGPKGKLIARTDDASGVVGKVIAEFDAAAISFGAVSISRPTLDDVYLHYAGRSYRADNHSDRVEVAA
ncbi:ATP-binding cassette domain-containing protein [Nocardia sp. CDC153]|uniref:ABC transporter ATP-binding protein n=1 Tax=Nocardia sp. CDC153 TaxID=3112167 RepID=UPI002DC04BE3|nr:ATP-binding cassette domain-containing protein [Nocardia sp. CDC153]MEC3954309.1 ATP-binding cassette domain-containing protein [Nocardia sp. CDC153]